MEFLSPNIFYLSLVESADVEPMGAEGHLYDTKTQNR